MKLALEKIFDWKCAYCGTQCSIIDGHCPKCGKYIGRSTYEAKRSKNGLFVGHNKICEGKGGSRSHSHYGVVFGYRSEIRSDIGLTKLVLQSWLTRVAIQCAQSQPVSQFCTAGFFYGVKMKFKPNKITTPAEHRALLLATMEAVMEGRASVPQANAIAGLSQQVHQSIRQEWDMRCYAAENLCLMEGEVIKMLETPKDDDD